MFTNEQLEAINIRNTNTLVSAAAGSGKTTVLAERIISLIINDKINIDELLVVTFTKDAAEEMKERIIKRLNKELEKKEDNFIIEQLIRVNKAQISTIDAFCSKILRTHFKLVDVDPNFRIGDKGELDLITDEAIEEFFEPLYESQDKNFLNVVNAFTKKYSDEKFIEIFLYLYEKTQNLPNPKTWLKNAYKQYDIKTKEDFYNSDIFQKILSYSKDILNEVMQIYDIIKTISANELDFVNNINNENTLEAFLNNEFMIYQSLIFDIENKMYDSFVNTIQNLSYGRWKPSFLKEDKELKEIIKSFRDISKEIVKTLVTNFFYKDINLMIEEIKDIYPILKDFCNLIIDFDDYILKIKKDKNIYTFSDISHFCLKILENEEVIKTYKKTFKEIIIDEYQDSNSVQETLLSSISDKNRFMVGDIKQCIYRFRQANPSLFNEKYISYNENIENGKRIDLNANFRSNKYVVDAINLIFENIMCKGLGEIDYDKNAKLYNKAEFKNPEPNTETLKNCSLNIINCAIPDNIETQELLELASDELEATYICQKISELLQNNTLVYESSTKSYRPIEYKDIVILMRNKSSFDTFSTILAKNNIPVYSESSSNFYDFIEIKTILNILNILINPLQDYALIGCMYSPIFSFSANELLEIKLLGKEPIFYNNLSKFIDNTENNELKDKVVNFIFKIEKWTELSKTLSIYELLSYIYEDSNYYNYLGLLEQARIRQANLLSLLEKSLAFEETNMNGLFNFINYINKFKQFSNDSKASILSKSENVVKIMTIHKSKGLEFPFVFLSNLSKQFNNQDAREQILFDEDYYLGLSIYKDGENLKPRREVSTIHKQLIKYKTKLDNYSEEIRILYVALTRAKENLFLTATVKKDITNALKTYQNLIPNNINTILPNVFINSSSSNMYLSWLYCAIKNFDTDNIWDINIIDTQSIMYNLGKTNPIEKISKSNYKAFEELLSLKIDKKHKKHSLDWSYKDKISQTINTTMSVTQIKQMSKLNDAEYSIQNIELPKFYTDLKGEFKSTDIGTIYHKILQYIDFSIETKDELDSMLNTFLNKKILTETELLYIDKSKILSFLNSDLAKRIKNSKTVKREAMFTIGIPTNQIYEDIPNINSNILVNGIIDLYFEENDYIVLVDYKTDKVHNKNILKSRYKNQIEIYKKALEQGSNKKVKESIIYSLYLQEEILL